MSEADFCFDEGQYLADKLQYEREHKYDPNIERIKNQREEIKRLNDLTNRQKAEIEALQGEMKEKTRTVFQKTINKILTIDDLYVIVNDEFVPCEWAEYVEHLFGMSISGDNEEADAETDRVVKEMMGDG